MGSPILAGLGRRDLSIPFALFAFLMRFVGRIATRTLLKSLLWIRFCGEWRATTGGSAGASKMSLARIPPNTAPEPARLQKWKR